MTTDPAFELHERLAHDGVFIADWPLCRVLLMNEADFPWLILVPRRAGLRDLHNLAFADLPSATGEIMRASQMLEEIFKPDKLNVAALGNQVPQLHIHVIARFTTDVAWPKPIWGASPHRPYDPEALAERVATLKAAAED